VSCFEIIKKDGKARRGRLHTPKGIINTPAFIPVGTQASVKALTPEEIKRTGTEIILSNTYHLYLRPGHEIIEKLGGLHRFMSWKGPILTDSGGFQVFSLAPLRTISEEGVTFRSHLDGSSHFLSPEKAMEIQASLGSDIAMVLDECPPYPCSKNSIAQSLRLTTRWAQRCKNHKTQQQMLYGIVQGGIYHDLRKESAQELIELNFDGYALGGLSVGESKEIQHEIVASATPLLPEEKPRYLMGIGELHDVVEAVSQGVDLFDCVIPTRNARNGALFTSQGKINIKREEFKEAPGPLDPECECEACTGYSRAYLRHLFISREILSMRLNTLHNLTFYQKFFSTIREAVEKGIFQSVRKKLTQHYPGESQ
jgi:queuine tRNA-ribosyltransferase